MDEVLYRDELLELEREHPGFALTLSLTRDMPRRPGDYDRRIDMPMVKDVALRLPAAPKHVFVCGSNAFANAASDAALGAGMPASSIRTERYGA